MRARRSTRCSRSRFVSDSVAATIPGSDQVIAWFGSWPTFHDAEVLELFLTREGKSWLRIEVCRKSTEPPSPAADDVAVITFWFEHVLDVELNDFSPQNVIFDLRLDNTKNGWCLTMSPCFGIAGYVEAEQVTVSVETR